MKFLRAAQRRGRPSPDPSPAFVAHRARGPATRGQQPRTRPASSVSGAPPMTAPGTPGFDASSLSLVGVSVVTVADSNNPSILNPDFLREFVLPDESWALRDSPICTPVHARVTYSNGVSVQSDPKRVVFEQSGDALDSAGVAVAEMARRYVRAVPHVKYTAIGINPSLLLSHPESAGALQEHLRGTLFPPHGGMAPKVFPKAMYAWEDRQITVEVFEAVPSDNEDPSLLFRGNIHRAVRGTDRRARIEHIEAIIQEFRGDLDGFRALVGAADLFRKGSQTC